METQTQTLASAQMPISDAVLDASLGAWNRLWSRAGGLLRAFGDARPATDARRDGKAPLLPTEDEARLVWFSLGRGLEGI